MERSRPDVREVAVVIAWTFVFPRPVIARLGPRGLLLVIAGLTAVHYVGRTMWRDR